MTVRPFPLARVREPRRACAPRMPLPPRGAKSRTPSAGGTRPALDAASSAGSEVKRTHGACPATNKWPHMGNQCVEHGGKMSNRDGMRRLREARRAAGFREVSVWVPAGEADAIATVARSMLVLAAEEGTPLPGDPELARISAGLDRETLVDMFDEACRDAGRVIEPWRLGFNDDESALLEGSWARAAHAEYRRWREDFSDKHPGTDAASIETAWRAHLQSSDSGAFDVISSRERRMRSRLGRPERVKQ